MWVYRPRHVPVYVQRPPFVPAVTPPNTCTVTYGTTFQTIDGFGVGCENYFIGGMLAIEDKATSATTAITGTFTVAPSSNWAAMTATYKCATTPAFVQEISGGPECQPASYPMPPFTANVTSGNFIVVCISFNCSLASVGTITVSDSLGQTYTQDNTLDFPSGGYPNCLAIYHFANTAAGQCTITIATTSSNGYTAFAREYSGVNTSTPYDKGATATGTGTAISTGATATLSQATELAIVFGNTDTATVYAVTAGSGFTNFSQNAQTSYSDSLADQTFSVSSGIGVSLLRTMIPPDDTTGNTSHELQMCRAAQSRGAKVWGTVWTPPLAWKSNGLINGGVLNSGNYTAFSNMLVNWVAYMAAQGIAIYGVSPQNEPDQAAAGYLGCGYSDAQYHTFMQTLGPIWATAGYASIAGKVLLLMPDESAWGTDVAASTIADATTLGYVDRFLAHYYSGSLPTVPPSGGKGLWQSEYAWHWNGSDDPTITSALAMCTDIHGFLVTAGCTSFSYYYVADGYTSTANSGLFQVDGTANKRLPALGNFSKFIRPGWVRIGESDSGWGLCSAYKSADGTQFAIVAINNTGSPSTVQFTLSGFSTNPSTVTPYLTDATHDLAAQTGIPVTSGAFSATLPANSVTTFTGTISNPNYADISPFPNISASLLCY